VDIKAVYSHPQALAQCERFWTVQSLNLIPTYEPGGQRKDAKRKQFRNAAAIASERAANLYGHADSCHNDIAD
jgi:prephenate dehydratase